MLKSKKTNNKNEKEGRSWKEKKRDGPGRKKEGRSWKKKRGTVLEIRIKDRPLFYKISLHILVDGNVKNVIFCRTKNA